MRTDARTHIFLYQTNSILHKLKQQQQKRNTHTIEANKNIKLNTKLENIYMQNSECFFPGNHEWYWKYQTYNLKLQVKDTRSQRWATSNTVITLEIITNYKFSQPVTPTMMYFQSLDDYIDHKFSQLPTPMSKIVIHNFNDGWVSFRGCHVFSQLHIGCTTDSMRTGQTDVRIGSLPLQLL